MLGGSALLLRKWLGGAKGSKRMRTWGVAEMHTALTHTFSEGSVPKVVQLSHSLPSSPLLLLSTPFSRSM